MWSEAYGLNGPLPPKRVDNKGAPRAPHLEDCQALWEARIKSEQGEGPWGLPAWTCARPGHRDAAQGSRLDQRRGGEGTVGESAGVATQPAFCSSPRPPWVRPCFPEAWLTPGPLGYAYVFLTYLPGLLASL